MFNPVLDRGHHPGPGRHERRHHRPGPGHEGPPWVAGFRILGGLRGGPGMRRGEIRPLVLAALEEKAMHGYELIQHLEAQSGGRWRPSAGSVYPTLELLADEGLATVETVEGRRVYSLTDSGRLAAKAAPEPRSRWGGDDTDVIGKEVMQLVGAVMQVQRVGSPAAKAQARTLLAETRRRIYGLLAEDDNAPAAPTETAAEAQPAE